MQKFWRKHILAENTEILAKTRNFFMFDEAPDQRVPKLVTVRLSSLEVNRKSERNSVFFPLEYIFSSENILAKMSYRILAKKLHFGAED